MGVACLEFHGENLSMVLKRIDKSTALPVKRIAQYSTTETATVANRK